MKKHEFKAESKRLLELMINSIYTHKEIFLRELISNASDAIDKLYYRSLKDGISGLSREEFFIRVSADESTRHLIISDNGIGMTAEELENNLGTIAKSGSLSFKNEQEADKENEDEKNQPDIDIIGQFGVGFYSAFMVADHIEVVSLAAGSEQANRWTSDGVDGYTLEPCDTPDEIKGSGTIITLNIKESTPDEDYDKFLRQYTIENLIKKYSDYIRYPIRMEKTVSNPVPEKEDEFEDTTEDAILNSMTPLWKRNKNEVTSEEYNAFYHDKFFDFTDPLKVIHTRTEGSAAFDALLFIPGKAPYNYYSKDYEKGLGLYTSGVMIMDTCKDLLPDCFSFVKGVVDSQDLSLNISREMLQHNRQLKLIASSIEKKIKSELKKMLQNEREIYEQFYADFGMQLKYGLYSSYGQKKELLSDLLMFRSSAGEGLCTLAEYSERMRENQKYIYYACGDSAGRVASLPQIERLLDLGYEVLYLTDDIDEFAIKVLGNWDSKEFRSASGDDLDLPEDKGTEDKAKQQAVEHKDMLDFLAESLQGKVAKVRPSQRLKTHPVCLTADGGISLEMERVLNAMPGSEEKIKAERVLEINADHPVFSKLCGLYDTDKEKLAEYAGLLYSLSLLIEGMQVDDPAAFSRAVCALL